MAEKAQATKENTSQAEAPKYEIKHIGFGRYEVNGEKFTKGADGAANKAAAEQRVRELTAQDELDETMGDVLPEGYDMKILDQPFVYRNSLMELPMNEPYAPDGSFNRFYDREWRWIFAAHTGTDISDKRAKGYKLVTLPELERGVKDGRYPEHLLNLFREEGSYLVYGDNVLMRIPRVLWRQKKEEKRQRDLQRIAKLDRDQRAFFEDRGVGVNETPVSNELKISM